MTRLARIPLAALALLPGVALAHSPIEGIDDFYAGFLHPVFVPGHLLSALVLGILFGQQGPQRVQAAVIAFLLATLAGLAASLWLPQPALELPLLIGAASGGILVALSLRLPPAVCGLLALALGVMIGLDSAQPQLVGRALLASLLGSGLAVYLLVLYAMVFADYFSRRGWQRIGLRVLGSWAAASALLVLSLSFAR
jgi:hydrogenase/urease accessory protein HupE